MQDTVTAVSLDGRVDGCVEMMEPIRFHTTFHIYIVKLFSETYSLFISCQKSTVEFRPLVVEAEKIIFSDR